MKTIEIVITEELSGKDIKSILFNHLRFSSRLVTMIKTDGEILINKSHATVRKTVELGDILSLVIPERKSQNIVPNNIKLDVIYEDEDILLVNKPYNMPTHPSQGHYENTLANAVMYRYRDTDFVFRAVNRLDRDTTGIVLIAKNQYCANMLCNEIKERRIQKEYIAVCCGKLPFDAGTVEAPIIRGDKSIIKRSVSDDGQYAKTDYTVLAYENGYSLVKLIPHTGRTHQIRVHMANLGTPLFGDFIYGKEIDGERTRLHCYSMEFIHPSIKETMKFIAPIPDDFRSFGEFFTPENERTELK